MNGYARVWHPARKNYIHLGVWDSTEADLAWRKLAAEYALDSSAGMVKAGTVTIAEMMLAYLEHLKRIKASENVFNIAGRMAEFLTTSAITLNGTLPVADFGPVQFSAWAKELEKPYERLMVDGSTRSMKGRSWATIRKLTDCVLRAYTWAITAEIVRSGDTKINDLQLCDPLLECIQAAKPKKRIAAESFFVSETIRFASPTVAAMIRVHAMTGMRSGELVTMRPMDLHQSGVVELATGQLISVDESTARARRDGLIGEQETIWIYAPQHHKREKYDQYRAIPILPPVQAIMDPFLTGRPADGFIWSSRESYIWNREAIRTGQGRKSQRISKKEPAYCGFKPQSYERAIERVCIMRGIPIWTPHQLRHGVATDVSNIEGNLRGAQALLGHGSQRTTELYINAIDFSGAIRAAASLLGKAAG
jgi:integrase